MADNPASDGAKTFWYFLVHTVFGILTFVVVFGAAVLLNIWIDWMQSKGVSQYLLQVLTTAEWAIVVVDSVLFFKFLFSTLIHGWRKL